MDEFTVILKARELVQRVKVSSIPVPVDLYLQAFSCKLKLDNTLRPGQSGCSFEHKGKRYIVVNDKESDERQRFTICHEVAHIDLGLPADHDAPPWSYAKRPQNEIFCDIYATELLLPYQLFRPLACKAEIGFAAVDDLADKFEASVTSTGSRFAAEFDLPCTFVLSENGKVKYASRSKPLREMNAWIRPGTPLPATSASAAARNGDSSRDAKEIAADVWFSDWRKGGLLLEEARHLSKFDQTLTLLWFDEGDEPREQEVHDDEDDGLLKELDGNLPWPGKKRRR